MAAAPPLLASVVRDGAVESHHRGHVAVATTDGLARGVGDPEVSCYPRSALKPLQAVATRRRFAAAGLDLDAIGTAIACASHEGQAGQQVEAARLLALGGLDEDALACPPARPADAAALEADPRPSRLAHNCSGKHAGFAAACALAGEDPSAYRDPDSPLQRDVAEVLAEVCGAEPAGPGVDGCGAPAWRLPLDGLARAFARLAAAETGELGPIRAAMLAHPDLVGGRHAADTRLMRAAEGLVAKRGAEGVLACGLPTPAGVLGLAVKIDDGAARATGPVLAAALAALGLPGLEPAVAVPVLGGGVAHGAVEPSDALGALA